MVHLLHAHCFVFVIFFLNRFNLFVCWQHSLKTKHRQSVLHVASLLLYLSCRCWNSKDIHFDYRITQLNMQRIFRSLEDSYLCLMILSVFCDSFGVSCSHNAVSMIRGSLYLDITENRAKVTLQGWLMLCLACWPILKCLEKGGVSPKCNSRFLSCFCRNSATLCEYCYISKVWVRAGL